MRKIAMLVLLLVLVGIIVWEQLSVNSYLNEIKDITDRLTIMVSGNEQINTTEILDQVDNLEDVWNFAAPDTGSGSGDCSILWLQG